MSRSHPAENSNKPVLLSEERLRSWPLPWPEEGGDKENRGSVLIIAGTSGMPGAAILAATAALRAGAGKLQIATPECIADIVAGFVPEAKVIALKELRRGVVDPSCISLLERDLSRAQAVLIGPGMDGGETLSCFIVDLLKDAKTPSIIFDAEALGCVKDRLRDLSHLESRMIITPHAGEMAKLLDIEKEKIQADPLSIARDFATQKKIITVLKGRRTHIAGPSGDVFCNDAGNVGLATSGSGDTLSGVIAGLAARGADPIQAAAWGVALHARAGDELAKAVGPIGYLARELLAEIPKVMKSLDGSH